MTLSNFVVQQILTTYFPPNASHYLALHIADPTTSGLASTEVSTVSTPVYARKPVTWSAPANRGVYNAAAVQWVGMPALEIGFLGVWDAVTNGNLLAALACPQPLVISAAGQGLYLAPGALAVKLAGSPTQRAALLTPLANPGSVVTNVAATPTTPDLAYSGNNPLLTA